MNLEKIIKNTNEKIKNILSKDVGKKVVLFAGILGIFLIFVSSYSQNKPPPEKQEPIKNQTTQEYIEKLESDLNKIISSIKGAGDAKVLITLENGMENVYATEERKNKEATKDNLNGEASKVKESDDVEKKYITIKDSDGSEKALSVMQIQPKVKGVVIVCKGGGNPEVQQRIREATKTLLNISSKRVFVTN